MQTKTATKTEREHEPQLIRHTDEDGVTRNRWAVEVTDRWGEHVRWDLIPEVNDPPETVHDGDFPYIERYGNRVVIRSKQPKGHATSREQEALAVLRTAGVDVKLSYECSAVCVRRFGHTGYCCNAQGELIR